MYLKMMVGGLRRRVFSRERGWRNIWNANVLLNQEVLIVASTLTVACTRLVVLSSELIVEKMDGS